jgi:HAD superfamily hydrolase (TIGR01484 family)
MRALSQFVLEMPADIRVLLFDIDDTLTTDGKLTAAAFDAMWRAKAAGLIVIPITGRPAGWCDHIARMWPVDAVVGENGAFYFRYDAPAKKLVRHFVLTESERSANRSRVGAVAQQILREIPAAAMSSDQAWRAADIAIDFCEDVPRLPPADVARIKALMEAAGLTAKISSIHVNGWIGDYDKLSTTSRLMRAEFGLDIDAQNAKLVFVGDSPNDQPMFAHFMHSVGVANVADFVGQLASPPKYVTKARSGQGFVELVDALLSRG